jgi:hypothetical protein
MSDYLVLKFGQIFPDMFDDYSQLRPWKTVANIVAKEESWGPLYDLEQLSRNEVKVSAVTWVYVVSYHLSRTELCADISTTCTSTSGMRKRRRRR